MEAKIITVEDYKEIINRLDKLTEKVSENQTLNRKQIIYDNAEALQILKCSRRSLQKWRTEGLITYSIVNSMLFYTHENLMEFIERHQKKRFK